jgi:hypothetical protein
MMRAAYVSIRQHTSAYVRKRARVWGHVFLLPTRRRSPSCCMMRAACVTIRQHTSAYVRKRARVWRYEGMYSFLQQEAVVPAPNQHLHNIHYIYIYIYLKKKYIL